MINIYIYVYRNKEINIMMLRCLKNARRNVYYITQCIITQHFDKIRIYLFVIKFPRCFLFMNFDRYKKELNLAVKQSYRSNLNSFFYDWHNRKVPSLISLRSATHFATWNKYSAAYHPFQISEVNDHQIARGMKQSLYVHWSLCRIVYNEIFNLIEKSRR